MAFEELPQDWLAEIETLQNCEANQQYQRIRRHQNGLRIYHSNYLQIRKHFAWYNGNYDSSKFWSSKDRIKNFKRKTNQFVFNYLSSAAAIADLSRKFAKNELPEDSLNQYQKAVDEKFVKNGANNFIRQMRNFVLHFDFLAVGIQAKIIPPPGSAHWIIDKQDLINYAWEKEGAIFFQNQGPKIDLFSILENYNEDFISLQDHLYRAVLKKYNANLMEFAAQNKNFAIKCRDKGVWPGPPLGLDKIRHLYWVLNRL